VPRGWRSRATIAGSAVDRAPDLVNCQIVATRPSYRWLAVLKFLAARAGFAFSGLAIDSFAHRIVAWRVGRFVNTGQVLDELDQALRLRSTIRGFVHHSDRNSRYLSIRYSERLEVVAEMKPSAGSKGRRGRPPGQAVWAGLLPDCRCCSGSSPLPALSSCVGAPGTTGGGWLCDGPLRVARPLPVARPARSLPPAVLIRTLRVTLMQLRRRARLWW